jgi:hypothetical protein
MKLNKGIALSIIAVFIFSIAVYAATFSFNEVFSATNPTFGSETQEVSNSQHDNEDEKIVFATVSLPLLFSICRS